MRPTTSFRFVLVASAGLLLGCERQHPLEPAGSEASSALSARGVGVQLEAPSNVTATAIGMDRIDLRWQDNSSHETGIEIRRYISGNAGAFIGLSAPANATSYSDQGIISSTEYCYEIRAVGVFGRNTTYSPSSPKACAIAAPPIVAPLRPRLIMVQPYTSSDVFIRWENDTGTPTDGYRVYRSTNAGVSWDLIATMSGVNAREFYDADRETEKTVCYQVVTFNAAGDSPPSTPGCTAPPARPTNLTSTRVDSQTVELAWTDNSAVEDGYEVWVVELKGDCGYETPPSVNEWPAAVLPANTTSYRTAALGWSTSALPPEGCAMVHVVYVVAAKDGGRSDPSD